MSSSLSSLRAKLETAHIASIAAQNSRDYDAMKKTGKAWQRAYNALKKAETATHLKRIVVHNDVNEMFPDSDKSNRESCVKPNGTEYTVRAVSDSESE